MALAGGALVFVALAVLPGEAAEKSAASLGWVYVPGTGSGPMAKPETQLHSWTLAGDAGASGARQMGVVHRVAMGPDPRRPSLRQRTAGAVAVGRVAMGQLYGYWAKQAQGARLERLIFRLGLQQAGNLTWWLSTGAHGSLTLHAELELPPHRFGPSQWLGPATPPRLPVALSQDVTSFVQMNVLPDQAWLTAERIFGERHAIQFALARAQLDALEQKNGISWLDDVLGRQPRAWTLLRRKDGAITLVLGLADGHAAWSLIEDMADIARAFVPSLTLTPLSGAGDKRFVLAWGEGQDGEGRDTPVYLLLQKNAVVIASRSDALALAHEAPGEATKGASLWSLPEGKARAFGAMRGQVGADLVALARRHVPVGPLWDLLTPVASVNWSLFDRPRGFGLQAHTTPQKTTGP